MPLFQPASQALRAVVLTLVVLHFSNQYMDCLHQQAAFRLNHATLASLTKRLAAGPLAQLPQPHPHSEATGGASDDEGAAATTRGHHDRERPAGRSRAAEGQPAAGSQNQQPPLQPELLHVVNEDLVRAVAVAIAAAEAEAQVAEAEAEATLGGCRSRTSPTAGSAGEAAGPARVSFAVRLFPRNGARVVLPYDGNVRQRGTDGATTSRDARTAAGDGGGRRRAPDPTAEEAEAASAPCCGGDGGGGGGGGMHQQGEGAAAAADGGRGSGNGSDGLDGGGSREEGADGGAAWVLAAGQLVAPLPLSQSGGDAGAGAGAGRYDLLQAVQLQMAALSPRLSLLLAPFLAAAGVELPLFEWWKRQHLPAFTPLPPATTPQPPRPCTAPTSSCTGVRRGADGAGGSVPGESCTAAAPARDVCVQGNCGGGEGEGVAGSIDGTAGPGSGAGSGAGQEPVGTPFYEGDAVAECHLETSASVWVLEGGLGPGMGLRISPRVTGWGGASTAPLAPPLPPSPHRARRAVCSLQVRPELAAALGAALGGREAALAADKGPAGCVDPISRAASGGAAAAATATASPTAAPATADDNDENDGVAGLQGTFSIRTDANIQYACTGSDLGPTGRRQAAAAAAASAAGGVPGAAGGCVAGGTEAVAAAAAGAAAATRFTLVVWEEMDTYTRAMRAAAYVSPYRPLYMGMSSYYRLPPGWLQGGLSWGGVPVPAPAAVPVQATVTVPNSAAPGSEPAASAPPRQRLRAGPGPGVGEPEAPPTWWSSWVSYLYGENGGTLYYCTGWLCDPSAFTPTRDGDPRGAQKPKPKRRAAAAPSPSNTASLSHTMSYTPGFCKHPSASSSALCRDSTAGSSSGSGTNRRWIGHLAAALSGPLAAAATAAAWLRRATEAVLYGVDWAAAWRGLHQVSALVAPLLLPHAAVLRWLWPLAPSPGVLSSDLLLLTVTAMACCYAEWLLVARLIGRWREDCQDARGMRLDSDTAAILRSRVWREAVEGPAGRNHLLAWRLRGPAASDGWVLATLLVLHVRPAALARTAMCDMIACLEDVARLGCRLQQGWSLLQQSVFLRVATVEAATRAGKQLLQVAATARMLHDSVWCLSLRQVAVAAALEPAGGPPGAVPGGLAWERQLRRLAMVRRGEMAAAAVPPEAVAHVRMAVRRFRNGGRNPPPPPPEPGGARAAGEGGDRREGAREAERPVVWPKPLRLPNVDALSCSDSSGGGGDGANNDDNESNDPSSGAGVSPRPRSRHCARPPATAPPRGFICAITHEVMTQPALLLSPQLVSAPSYERDAIRRWLAVRRTDPRTNTPLRSFRLLPNDDLQRAIDDWARGVEAAAAAAAAEAAAAAAADAEAEVGAAAGAAAVCTRGPV